MHLSFSDISNSFRPQDGICEYSVRVRPHSTITLQTLGYRAAEQFSVCFLVWGFFPGVCLFLDCKRHDCRLLKSECTLECNNGGTQDKKCESCTGCDELFDPKTACKTCLLKCEHGEQDATTCACTCANGWEGKACDTNLCKISLPGSTVQVHSKNFK